MIKTYRDIQLIDKDKTSYLAVACDVSASIGPKDQDIIKVTAETAGYYAAAVPIIELLAIGAEPISVVDTLGVEMVGIGEAIIRGVQKAMAEGAIDPLCLTGSTEDNIPTVTTTVGITVIAELQKHLIDKYKPLAGQKIFVVGRPKMGEQFLEEEVIGNKGEVITIGMVEHLRCIGKFSHMLPVGSKGIRWELDLLLAIHGLKIVPVQEVPIDMEASAGPATCMLVTCDEAEMEALISAVTVPVTFLGTLLADN